MHTHSDHRKSAQWKRPECTVCPMWRYSRTNYALTRPRAAGRTRKWWAGLCSAQTAITHTRNHTHTHTIPCSTLLRKTTFLAWSALQRSVAERKWKRARLAIAPIRRLYMPSIFFPVSLSAAKFWYFLDYKTLFNYKFFSPQKETVLEKYAKVTRE